jgi:hypothetical protein
MLSEHCNNEIGDKDTETIGVQDAQGKDRHYGQAGTGGCPVIHQTQVLGGLEAQKKPRMVRREFHPPSQMGAAKSEEEAEGEMGETIHPRQVCHGGILCNQDAFPHRS